MEVSKTGKNLNIILLATDNPWMSFACWYSLNRHLPDAKILVALPRSPKIHLFRWLFRLSIPYCPYTGVPSKEQAIEVAKSREVSEPLVVSACAMAVKKLDLGSLEGISQDRQVWTLFDKEKIIPGLSQDCRVSGDFVFVSYKDSISYLTITDWEKTTYTEPFGLSYKLRSSINTLNEKKILDLWAEMASLYAFLNS